MLLQITGISGTGAVSGNTHIEHADDSALQAPETSFWQTLQNMGEPEMPDAQAPSRKADKPEKELSIEDFRLLILLIMSGASEEAIAQEIANALDLSPEELAALKASGGLMKGLLDPEADNLSDVLKNVQLSEQTKSDIQKLKSLVKTHQEQKEREDQAIWRHAAARSFLQRRLAGIR